MKLFDPQAPTIIYSDASLLGASSVLFQTELVDGRAIFYPIAFFSLRFTPIQQRYSTVERELFAVLHTLEHALLLLSPDITVYTDNKGIFSIGNTYRQTHPRFAKFLDLLNVYRLTWKYVPGPKNVVADYLSRYGLDGQPELDFKQWDVLATEVTLRAIATTRSSPDSPSSSAPSHPTYAIDLPNEEFQPLPSPETDAPPTAPDETFVYQNCQELSWPELISMKHLLSEEISEIPVRFSQIFSKFHLSDDILYVIEDTLLFRVITDYDYVRLATKLHNYYHCSHRVLKWLLNHLRLWNPNSPLLSYDVVRNCQHCEMYTKFRDLQAKLPSFRHIPLFSRWHLDFAGPLPNSNGHLNVLIAVDYTSNFIMVLPVGQHTAKSALLKLHMIFSLFGIPKYLVSDNGSPFANKVVRTFAENSKVNFVNSSAYHPRGNSKAECSVQLIQKCVETLYFHYRRLEFTYFLGCQYC